MSLVDSSVAYTQDLQAQKVVAFGLYQQDEQWYQQNAPWQYTPGPNCTKSAAAIAAIFGKQLKGETPSSRPGACRTTPEARHLLPEPPTQHACEQAAVQDLAPYGVSPVAQASLTFDISQLPSESATAVAQMKQAGATTIICVGCDPISPIYYFESATADNYHPEWFFQSLYAANTTAGETWIRLLPADQRPDHHRRHAGDDQRGRRGGPRLRHWGTPRRGPPSTRLPPHLRIDHPVLRRAPGGRPEPDAVEPRGGHEGHPPVVPRRASWATGTARTAPTTRPRASRSCGSTNDAISPADGLKGTYEVCNDGTVYPYDDAGTSLPASTPLVCKCDPQVTGHRSDLDATRPADGHHHQTGAR